VVAELPSGTVTMLFTDVEGATELARTLGDDYAGVLVEHRRLVREVVERFGGHEVDCRDDELFVVFERSHDAIAAAAEMQRALTAHDWPQGAGVRVRAAVHTGEPILAEGGYVGVDVQRVARICAAGHGGQVLLSQAAYEAVRDADSDWSFTELGALELVGLPRPERVVQLHANGLADAFPALLTAADAEPSTRETTIPSEDALRVTIAEDSVLLREGLASLLESAGFQVVGQSGTPDDLLLKVRSYAPDVAIVDVRMPPTHTDEGLRAAREIRERHPSTGVLILSQHVEADYAFDLLADNAEGIGYLLKDRVHDVDDFVAAVRRVATGGTAFDSLVVSTLLRRSVRRGTLDVLTERERSVLGLMAEGLSNGAIAEHLYMSLRAVERHVGAIFDKLDLPADSQGHRRVLAVLAFLQE
jgi:DNA-binding NarL/FixJ family response regulator/class 3 adenylate cyclase